MSRAQLGKKHIGRKVSEETKQKIRKTLTGRKLNPLSEEHKEKISKANIGKKTSAETRKKQSEAKKGKPKKPFTEEHKRNISIAKKGCKSWSKGKTGIYSIETLLKKSLSAKGKKFSKEHKEKIRLSRIGKKQSKETVQKRVEATLATKLRIKQEKLSMIF